MEMVDLDKLLEGENEGPEAPPGFVFLDLGFELPHLNVTFDNEFDQRLCDTRIEKFEITISLADNSTIVDVTLADFFVEDLWTGASLYPYIATLKNDEGADIKDACSELAVRVKFEYKSDHDITPYHLSAHFE